MENQEDILDALRDFEKKPALNIPPVLEEYLGRVASTGETLFPWPKMKPLFVKKLDEVMSKFQEESHMDNLPPSPNVENVKFDAMRSRILSAIDRFHGAPFTIQRLCELITNPKKHYKRADKFLRGVEKNILVVSTVDPFGRKVVCESKNLVNGLDSNGHAMGEGDATHETTITTSTITPASPWPSPGANAFAAANKTTPTEAVKTEDMQCSEDPGEITGPSQTEAASPLTAKLDESDNENKLSEKPSESKEAANEENSNQTDIASKDTEITKEQDQEVCEDQIEDKDSSVFTNSQISDESEAECTSLESEQVPEIKEELTTENTDNVSSVSNPEETESIPNTVTEKEKVETSSNLVDSSTAANSSEDENREKGGFTKDKECGGGDEAGKTEEPSSSDGEEGVGHQGDGDVHSEVTNEVLEETISSSESAQMSEIPPEPMPSEEPKLESSGEVTVEKEADSPSQSFTAEQPQNISEDACMSSKVATSDLASNKSDISVESSQDSIAEEKLDQSEGGNVSSSSESVSVAMDTEDSSTRTSDSSENTSDSSASDNLCSTSDIPEPMEED